MSKQITINSHDDLLEFILLDSTTLKDAIRVTEQAYNVFCHLEEWKSKEDFIQRLKYYIEHFYKKSITDRPLFLTNIDFMEVRSKNPADILKTERGKRFIEKFERDY